MRIRIALGTLPVALAAAVALAAPALAQGGGGGGTGGGGGGVTTVVAVPCASITSWTTSLQTIGGQSKVVLRVGVPNNCVDEGAGAVKLPAVSFTNTDTATGKRGSSATYFANVGQWFFTDTFLPTSTPAPQTVTVTVTRPNGQLQASRSATIAEILQSVQQAA